MVEKLNQIKYILLCQWNFENTNFYNLKKYMNENDREIFPIDTRSTEWNAFVKDFCLGVRNYLLKQNEN